MTDSLIAALHAFFHPRRRERTPAEIAVLATARRTARRDLTLYEWGDGPLALLIHGWSGDAAQMSALVRPLLASGHRVVAVDAPAHGATPGARTNVVAIAAAVAAALPDLGPVDTLVAHSLGAAVAARLVRIGAARPRRLVLIAPAVDIAGAVARFGHATGQPGFAAAALAEVGVPAAELDVRGAAGAAEIIILHDPRDREVPFADAEALARAWPDARLIALPGAGHTRILTAPAAVAHVAAFVEELDLDTWLFDRDRRWPGAA